MRTFVQKPKATQQTTPLNSTIPSRAHLTQSRDMNSILYLQRTIGNQAVQRLLQANAEDLEKDSGVTAANHFGHDFSQIPLYPPKPETVQTKLTISQPGDNYEREADRVAAQVMQLPVASVSSDGSSRALQRKCAACESGQGLYPQCAQQEKRVRRMLITTDMVPAIQGGIGDEEPVPMKDEPKKPPSEKKENKKEEPAKTCPAESITISGAKCGEFQHPEVYGAIAKYCYLDDRELWFKESVKDASEPKSPCSTGVTDQSAKPGKLKSHSHNCIRDEILNQNGPPSKVAPCKDKTLQTLFVGPTEDTVEQCKYSHEQLTEVTVTEKDDKGKPKAGKVITSSDGASTDCDWKA